MRSGKAGIGIGMEHKRCRKPARLSAIRLVLTRGDPAAISIGDLAFEYGFPETGRFAAYYRAHFGETPSDTLRSQRRGMAKRSAERAQQTREDLRNAIGFSVADKIEKLSRSGSISDEFARLRANLLKAA